MSPSKSGRGRRGGVVTETPWMHPSQSERVGYVTETPRMYPSQSGRVGRGGSDRDPRMYPSQSAQGGHVTATVSGKTREKTD